MYRLEKFNITFESSSNVKWGFTQKNFVTKIDPRIIIIFFQARFNKINSIVKLASKIFSKMVAWKS